LKYFWFQKRWILVSGFMETTIPALSIENNGLVRFKIDTDYAFFNTWNRRMNSGYGISVLSKRKCYQL
jgi:hypothetical protein